MTWTKTDAKTKGAIEGIVLAHKGPTWIAEIRDQHPNMPAKEILRGFWVSEVPKK